MKRYKDDWPVSRAYARKRVIDPNPQYQRVPTWDTSRKQWLIDSLIRDLDVPKFYLTKAKSPEYEWEVVDGQQRLRAIWEFKDGEYKLSGDSDPVKKHVVADRYYDDLHYEVKEELDSYSLSIIILEEEDEQEIEEMFLRLQNGMSLNSAEKRNAISGNMRDFVHNVAKSHELFTKSVAFANKRYAHDESVSQMMLIEMKGNPTIVTHSKLKEMYETGRDFRNNSAVAKKLNRVLNFLANAFPEKSPELSKVNLISLYTVASGLLEKYAISRRHTKFGEWFKKFEQRRREYDDEPLQDDEEMLDYKLAVLQRTGSVQAQEMRRGILMKDLLASVPDLPLLDKQRQFTEEQRIVIFRRASGKCYNPDDNPECVKNCTWDNWHADHIIPHSQGGRTTVANGQLLCPNCNQKKSDRMPAAVNEH